ncbi:MAG: DNA alkylation repair protein [Bacteroidota bacterium]
MNAHHRELLATIRERSGKPTQHTFSDSYLGNSHPRYPVDAPTLREIARSWAKTHRHITADEFSLLLDSLIKGKSGTEKVMAGILLDGATSAQKKFKPQLFDRWLDHLEGWAEIDAVCTGKYTVTEIPDNPREWKKLLAGLARSKNINKRRASLVFLTSPIRHSDETWLVEAALQNIDRLKNEKEIIITRAISWLLRSMCKLHRSALVAYLQKNETTLPPIAVRETRVKLTTGTKSGGRKRKTDK